MNTKSMILGLGLTMMAAGSARAAEYTIDAGHSRVGFKVRHLVSQLPGEFKDYDGAFSFDEKNPKAAKVKFTVKAASISTNDAKRDEHLRSPDFFDTDQHPTLAFVGSKLTPAGKGKYQLEGDLTIRGITKPVKWDVDYFGAVNDPWGNRKAGFQASAKINRKDYGIVWNKALDAGGVVVGDDVTIQLDLEALEAKAPAGK